jgi:hypothetical protein
MSTPESLSIEGQLAVINTKLDLLIEQRADQEARLRKLEQFKYVLVGLALAAGGAAGRLSALA